MNISDNHKRYRDVNNDILYSENAKSINIRD